MNSISRVVSGSTGFILNHPTLAVRNVARRFRDKADHVSSSYADSSLVVQVTPKVLILLEPDLLTGEYTEAGESWTPENSEFLRQYPPDGMDSEIVAASINPSQFLLGLSGGIIVLLNLNENRFQVVRQVFAPPQLISDNIYKQSSAYTQ